MEIPCTILEQDKLGIILFVRMSTFRKVMLYSWIPLLKGCINPLHATTKKVQKRQFIACLDLFHQSIQNKEFI